MNRAGHLTCSVVMLGLAALAGVSMARWRNQTDLAKEQPPPSLPVEHRPSPISSTGKESNPEVEITARLERQMVSMEDAGILFRTPQPTFFVADNEGNVEDGGLDQAGVSRLHKGEIQAALDAASKRMLASMKERVQVDERNSDPEKNIRAYLIPARMGLREEVLGKLESDFVKICGPEKGPLLVKALHPSGRFGYFGRQSLMVRVVTGPDGSGKMAEYQSFDPISGREASGGTMSDEEMFRRRFGDAIEW